MKLWKEKNRVAKNNNRINLVMAIIFLLGGGLLARLYTLQVSSFDLYAAKASGQHQVSGVLQPERGRIFIQDRDGSNKLYPIASNKKFALLYAVPRDVREPEKLAENLFAFFKQEQAEIIPLFLAHVCFVVTRNIIRLKLPLGFFKDVDFVRCRRGHAILIIKNTATRP